jgi:uncharacterized protein involved in exopolysaccharide biosynthesis
MLFRRKAIFLAVFLTIFAASAWSLKNQQVVYVAEAKVLVIRGADPTVINQRPYQHWWEEMKTEVEIARSPHVLDRAVARLAHQQGVRTREETQDLGTVDSEPVDTETLRGGLGVEPIDETDVIRITYRALDRRSAIDGVNAVTEAYMEHAKVVRRDPQAAQIYRGEIERLEGEVDRLSVEIANYKNQYRISDINAESLELTRQRKAVENNLIDVRAERHATEIELDGFERRLEKQPDLLIPSEEMKRDPQVATYARRLAELDAQLNTLLATYTRDNPQVRAVERDRQSCVASIREQVQQFIGMKRSSLEALAAREQAFQGELERIDQRMAELPVHESNLDRMAHELKGAKESLDLIREREDLAQLRQDLDPKFSKLRLLHEAASASRLGGGARKQLFLVASIILALGLSFVAAFMIDTLDHTIKFPNDIEEALGVPVLASIREVRGSWKPAGGGPGGPGG